MIGTIEIRVNSANPQMPLKTLATFQGSPSTIRLLEVPKAIGEWNITDVKILVKYPDNTRVAKSCVRVGNIWQGTISAPEMSGKVQNGFEVIADGEDEDGNPVENYILGIGDVEVLSRDTQALKDVEKVYVKFSDELPLTASKGDFVYHNGQYYIFNGTTWDAISTGGEIPTKVSELENDVGYITSEDLPEIPTKVSQLSNDTGFITNDEVETEQLINKGKTRRLTYDGKMGVRYITQTGEFGPWQDSQLITNVYVDNKIREVRNEIPTKVSQLSNDAGYITENDLPEIPTKVSELENDVPYVTNGRMLDVEDEIESIQQDLGETIGRVDALRGEVDTLAEDSERMNQLINGMSRSIQDIEHKIPSQASTDNQLADKDFVNSSIATNTANFRGTYESEDDFPLSGNTPNDYIFFDTEEEENRVFKRYKWTGSTWAYEYTLNNSSFTSNQWATINSGVTQTTLNTLSTNVKSESKSYVDEVASELATYDHVTTMFEEAVVSANSYTDNAVAGLPTYDHVTTMFEEAVASANSYTDNSVAGLPTYEYVEQRTIEVVDGLIQLLPTLTLSGQYEDGTTFSFNIFKK